MASAAHAFAKPLTIKSAVTDRIRRDVMTGTLQPGQTVTEAELALALGVSHAPVREALADLAGEGLIEIFPNRRRGIAPIDGQRTLDLLQVQTALWRMGVVWGLPQLTATHLRALEAAVDAYADALARRDMLAAIQAGHAFHTVIIGASGNQELLRVTLDRRALIARFVLLCGAHSVSAKGLDQYRAILRAVRDGHTDRATVLLDEISKSMIALGESHAAQHPSDTGD